MNDWFLYMWPKARERVGVTGRFEKVCGKSLKII